MKPRLLLHLLPALLVALATTAQPTWRFHLAFEDGTGARDTLWFIYDSTATLPVNPWPGPNVDYELGEGPVDTSDGLFHVFMRNANWDSTNTVAVPYAWFPIFETGNTIDAINWAPPMTITWDTSLFHAPYLPYDQGSFGIAIMDGLAFSAHMNHPELGFGIHDMLINDSVTIDFLWDYLFTFGVYFGPDNHLGIHSSTTSNPLLSLHPNPASITLHLQAKDSLVHITIVDLAGHKVRE